MATAIKFPAKWMWMLPILLLTTLLASQHLTTDVYWFDELANLRKMGVHPYPPATPIDIIANVGVTKWPPAYNFILLAWGNIAGWSELATRALSLFMGVLSVAMMYRLGKSLAGFRAGIISASLLGTSVFFLFYAHEIRGYIQYALLSITLLYLYWHHSQKPRLTFTDGLVFVITGAVLIYTHYVALFVAFSIGVYHLFLASRTNQWGKRLRWLIYIGVTYLPWIVIAVFNAIGETVKDRGLDPITIIETAIYAFSNGLWFILIPLVLYALIAIRDRQIVFLVFTSSLFLTASLITNVFTDYLFHIRHIIGLLPFLIVISALALNRLIDQTKGLAWGLILLWVIAGTWFSRDLSFMDSLPGGLENRPLTMYTEVQRLSETCINEDDFLLTHLATEQNIWNVYVEQFYWWQPEYTVAMLEPLLNYAETRPDDFVIEGTYENRLISYTEDATKTWVVIAEDAYASNRLQQVGEYLADTFDHCGIISAQNHVTTIVYQNTADFSCNTNAQTLPTCAPDLLADMME